MVIVLEPDIRSNLIAWRSGARQRLGYWTGGGGALLTDALAYEPASHVADNALALIRHAAGGRTPPATERVPLSPPDSAIA
jgi:ADP-heptose:LPS heptosyltransferase